MEIKMEGKFINLCFSEASCRNSSANSKNRVLLKLFYRWEHLDLRVEVAQDYVTASLQLLTITYYSLSSCLCPEMLVVFLFQNVVEGLRVQLNTTKHLKLCEEMT